MVSAIEVEREEALGYAIVGKPVPRVDAQEKVLGKAIFGVDVKLPGTLHGKVLRSPYAHALILHIDTSRAKRLPGVRAVVTGRDVPAFYGAAIRDQPFLAIDRVRYIGEGVAAVAAINEEIALEALELIEVVYQELPPVFDALEAASPGAPLIHPDILSYHREASIDNPIPGTNVCYHFKLRRGDVEQGFGLANYLFEDTFATQRVQHCALEPHAAVAQVDASGRITVWTHNDAPYRCRRDIAQALGVPMTKVRIISPYQGGGFGGKGGLVAEPFAVALALHTDNRPVRVAFTREEVFTSALVRHPATIHIKSGVRSDGTILARKVEIYWDTGAYAEKGPTVCRQASYPAAGPYQIENVRVDGYCVYTNNAISAAFRGYGFPQTAWAYECHMDSIAAGLEMDPLELRMKNAFQEGSISATGEVLESVGLRDCLRLAAQAIGWGEGRREPNRGKGIACMFKNTNTPSASFAFLKINEDGTVVVLASTMEIGQGSRTVLTQIAAEELGVPLASVSVTAPDTEVTPFDMSTTASRSTFHMGNAIRQAAQDAKRQLQELAGQALGLPAEELEVREGRVLARRQPEQGMSLAEVIRYRYGSRGGNILGRGQYYPEDTTGLDAETGQGAKPSTFWSYAAQAAEVEVDTETGQVRVLRMAAAHDVGKAINPQTCQQQIEGGVVMGLGTTLYEHMLTEGGRTLNPNFLDYKLPTPLDTPQIQGILVEIPHPEGPFGAKGVGETVLSPTAAAVANALCDAVGVRIRELPITPERVLEALKEKVAQKTVG